MKKFISAAAALATAMSCAALSAGAMFEDIPSKRLWENEIDIFSAMDNGSLVTDIDKSGAFDLTDCFLLFCCAKNYESGDSVREYAEAAADYNGDNVVDEKDAAHLIRYYLINNTLTREVTKADYYNSINKQYNAAGGAMSGLSIDSSPGKNFSKALMEQSDNLMSGYPVFCEMLESGEIDFDINGDGKLFYDDINYMWVYIENRSSSAQASAYLPGDMYYPCQKLFEHMRFNLKITWVCEYGLMYCFEKYGADAQYLSDEYYDEVFAGSGSYGFGRYADQQYKEWLPKSDKLSFSSAYFNKEYIEFTKKAAENSSAVLVDTNGDGVLNITDTFNTYIYMDDLYSEAAADTTILPDKVWEFFTENCDLNGNGISGDLHDLNILNLYATENLDAEAMEAFFGNYSDKLAEYISGLSKDSGRPSVKYSPEKHSSPVALSIDIERTGDANADGTTDMADVVMIMQSLANPDNYRLSALGRFNGDINNTNDGITVMDAQAIQNRLLGLE